MTAFLAIVKLTYKSAIRSYVFQILLAILIITIIVLPLTVVGDGTAHAFIQISLQYCLGAIGFLLSMSTIWLGCFTMGTDVENYQLHMVISKPVSRITIWLGKCVGVIALHTVLLIISSLLVYSFILLQFYHPGFISVLKLPIFFMCIGAAVLAAGVFFFNFFMKKTWVYKLSFILLLISGLLLVVHYLIPLKAKQQAFTTREKDRITNEVLVGRRVFLPEIPDTGQVAMQIYNNYLAQLKKQNKPLTEDQKRNLKLEINKRVVASIGEVYPGMTYFWRYRGLDPNNKTPLYLRYRTYIGKVSTKAQRQTMGLWGANINMKIPIKPDKNKKTSEQSFQNRQTFDKITPYPTNIMCGIFNEIRLNPKLTNKQGIEASLIDDQGNTIVGFANFDPQGKKLFFQKADGPKLLLKVSSFFENYFRGVFMIFAKLTVLAGLSCAIGGIISIPVAIFSLVSYLLFGVFSSYLIGIDEKMMAMGGPSTSSSLYDLIGNSVSRGLMLIIIPMQNFEVSGLLAGGEIIELTYIAKVLIVSVFIKCLIVVALGIWIYRKREMGLLVRK